MQFNVKMDTKKLLQQMDYYKKEAIPKATVTAINRTLKETVTEVKRIMTADYQIKSSDIARISYTYNASISKPYATLGFKDYQLGFAPTAARLNTAKWKATNTKGRGVKIRIKKGSDAFLRHGFLLTFKSGHVGVFTHDLTKVQKKGNYKGSHPLKEIKGPSLPYLIKAKGRMDRINNFINEHLNKNFLKNLKFFSNK